MIGQDNRLKKIVNLLPQTKKIRNVSIVAHVDHGKTTIADCLISSNGIIHKKQAGQLRLLDDRLDQQDRGITMKSSSISLIFQDHLINLIDSPGHLQFYSQVSSALRLTDSALLVVDVVEGVSSQTFRVLNQLYDEKLPSILVLNKIDKLITSCKMDPMQAYTHLNQIIQQVNAVLGSFITKQLSIDNLQKKIRTKSEDFQANNDHIQILQSKFYFSAQKKNIVFGSALDNWGFSIQNFSPLIAKKLNEDPQKITKYLWGDFYLNPKTKTFSGQPRNQNDRPVCVDFVLKPIWDIFQNVQGQNKEKIQKIITTLGLKISQHAKKTYNLQLVKEILNAWLPFDVTIMKRIIQILPNPIQAQNFRLPYLLNLDSYGNKVQAKIQKALQTCSFEKDQPLIAFVSKMVNVPKGNFNQRGMNQLMSNDNYKTLGFGRIFSGKIKRGSDMLVIAPKKKKITNQLGQTIQVPDIYKVKVDNLYIFNGQYPDGIAQAYAGNIVGFGNLQQAIFKSGTISSEQNCISFVPINNKTKSILKVSISTPNIEDNHKLMQGLKKLNKSDPSVDVYIQSTGDIILNTCGEVHLQKCVVDLQKIYCKIPIQTSDPIISFRETIIWTNLQENKNMKLILQNQRKKIEKQKKLLKQKFKQEKMIDAELDQHQKEKLKAIQQWESHVQKYESQDLTVTDTRFFFKEIDDQEQQKYSYKQEKQLKKVDHKNKGKMHTKQKFLNLNLKTNVNKQLTPNQILSIKIKAIGLNFQVVEFLQRQSDLMKNIFEVKEKKDKQNNNKELFQKKYTEDRKKFMKEFFDKMQEEKVDENVKNLIKEKIVCFGPNGYGSNILIFKNLKKGCSLYDRIFQSEEDINQMEEAIQIDQNVRKILEDYKTTISELQNSIKLGFNIACGSGPLCNEPMVGVIFIFEGIKQEPLIKPAQKIQLNKITQKQKIQEVQKNQITEQKQKIVENTNKVVEAFGPLAGQITSTVKDTCIQAFLGGSPRLVEPMYLCQLQTDQQYYGGVYNQLSKRRAIIISEDLHQISNVFIIKAYLPVIESHKFCHQLLDKSQGTVNAQLHLDTWKVYLEDPFYVPMTQEEIQEDGLDNIVYNHARVLLQKIRSKKGLSTTQKIVVAAEKQRNLKKK